MNRRNKIIYWIATAWLALGMLSTGLVQLFRVTSETDFITRLGYPEYFLNPHRHLEDTGLCGRDCAGIAPVEGMGLCRLFLCSIGRVVFSHSYGKSGKRYIRTDSADRTYNSFMEIASRRSEITQK